MEEKVWALVDAMHGDWTEDEDGRVWEYGYDLVKHVWRWFEVDLNCYRPEGRRVERPQARTDTED